MIYIEVTLSRFRDEFNNLIDRKGQFSYDALEVIYNDIMAIADCNGEPYELDVIAICCEYTEYDNYEELAEQYDLDPDGDPTELDQFVGETCTGSIVVRSW